MSRKRSSARHAGSSSQLILARKLRCVCGGGGAQCLGAVGEADRWRCQRGQRPEMHVASNGMVKQSYRLNPVFAAAFKRNSRIRCSIISSAWEKIRWKGKSMSSRYKGRNCESCDWIRKKGKGHRLKKCEGKHMTNTKNQTPNGGSLSCYCYIYSPIIMHGLHEHIW